METREIKITRETAERWYNGCDKELKELALQTYPELKPKYESGKWYKGKYHLFRCTRLNNSGQPLGYGWGKDGSWEKDSETPWRTLFASGYTEATHEEVEQRFKEEAKKRGYYDKPFVCLYHGNNEQNPEDFIEGYFESGRFWIEKGCVFDNGKWAEFVKEPEYKIGEVYAFADSEDNFEKGDFRICTLTDYDETSTFRFVHNNVGWKHIRKIEYKFVD